jgi:nucleotide-binding universal stress UspA family protein
VGAVVIVLGSLVWYLGYVRSRVDRTGAATDAIRQQVTQRALTDVAAVAAEDTRSVLVAFTKDVGPERERALVGMAADLVRGEGGRVLAIRFEEVPDQAPLTGPATTQSAADRSFEARMKTLGAELDIDVDADEVVSHDTKRALVNAARHRGVGLVLAEHEPLRLRSRLLGDPIDWVVRHAPCDVLLVDNLGYEAPDHVALEFEQGYPPLAVTVAEALTAANDGHLSLWYPQRASRTEKHEQQVEASQADLSSVLSVPVRTTPVVTDGGRRSRPEVLVRRGTDDRLRGLVAGSQRPVPQPGCTTVTVYPHESRRSSLARRCLERVVDGGH